MKTASDDYTGTMKEYVPQQLYRRAALLMLQESRVIPCFLAPSLLLVHQLKQRGKMR